MADKVVEFTQEDIALANRIVQDWIENSKKTDRADRELVNKTLNSLYVIGGLKPPGRIEWFDSPFQGAKRVAELTDSKVSNQLYYGALGQQDAHWIAFWEFFNEWKKIDLEEIKGIRELAILARQIGWWWPFDEVCIISERPVAIHLDAAGRLHCEDDMAVKYADGWGLYSWHGYRLQSKYSWLITDKDRITPTVIEKETNAEMRRIMLEIHGFTKYLAEREAALISEDIDGAGNPRKLWEITVRGEKIRIIELLNSTLEPDGTRRRFHLGALPANDPQTAVAASFGFNPKKFVEAVCS